MAQAWRLGWHLPGSGRTFGSDLVAEAHAHDPVRDRIAVFAGGAAAGSRHVAGARTDRAVRLALWAVAQLQPIDARCPGGMAGARERVSALACRATRMGPHHARRAGRSRIIRGSLRSPA